MKSTITLQATSNAWLINSVLAPHLDAFTAHLQIGRYAVNTTRSYVAGIAHFAYWMTQSKICQCRFWMNTLSNDSLSTICRTVTVQSQ